MLTKVRRKKLQQIEVASLDERVQVVVEQDGEFPLTKAEVHEALLDAEAATHEFLAAVEADIEATADAA